MRTAFACPYCSELNDLSEFVASDAATSSDHEKSVIVKCSAPKGCHRKIAVTVRVKPEVITQKIEGETI